MQQDAALSRIHQSWLARSERRMLTWLAANMPAWVTPDRLTMLGLFGALLAGLSYVGTAYSPRMLLLACFGLVLNWFGDSLDGSLARYRGIERPRYGFFVDHSADVVSQILIFFGLGLSAYMRFDMALLALLSYWLAALYTFIRAVATRVFQISYLGVGPTEIRLGLVLYTLALPLMNALVIETPIGRMAPIDDIVLVTFCAVLVLFVVSVYGEGRRLAALEPQPARKGRPQPLHGDQLRPLRGGQPEQAD